MDGESFGIFFNETDTRYILYMFAQKLGTFKNTSCWLHALKRILKKHKNKKRNKNVFKLKLFTINFAL